jgi:signal transduction histidine kinase
MKHTLGASALRGLLDATPGAVGCFDANLRAVYANTAFTMTTGVQAGRVLENGPLATEVRELLAGRGSAPRRVRIGGERRLPISGTLFALEDNLVGMVLDAGGHEALALLADEQSALRRVAVLVASSPEPEAVFQAVAEEAGKLLHVRSAATIRYEGGQAWTVGRWADEHDPGGFAVGTSVPLADSDGLTAIVARTGRPARIEDYGEVRGHAAELMRNNGFRSAVAAPIVAGGRTWGLVLVASVDALGSDAEQRLAGFAELVALALESAEARAELNALSVRILEAGVTERRRLERNLHDGAQQRLVSIAVQLRVLEKRLGDPDAAVKLLRGAARELEHALAELRELARGLHPAVLSDRGLRAAVEMLAGRSPVPVEIAEIPDERLPEAVEAAAYYLIAEALTNVAKYAGASGVRVRVAATEETVLVEVADDGVGGADPAGGSGLRGLADRVEALGGSLAVASPAGAGTSLRAEIPR